MRRRRNKAEPAGEPATTDQTTHRFNEDVDVTYRVKITPRLVYAILGPYFGGKIAEQVKALLPITGFLFLFQLVVIREGVVESAGITAGLMGVVLGLMFFMDGIRFGLMPLGTEHRCLPSGQGRPRPHSWLRLRSRDGDDLRRACHQHAQGGRR